MKALYWLIMFIPCLTWAQITFSEGTQGTYAGVTIYSISTSGDASQEITVSAGCIFTGVTFDQAYQMGLVNFNRDISPGSIVTTYQGYDLNTQIATVKIPDQTFTLQNDGLTSDQCKTLILQYINRRYQVYADQIKKRYFKVSATKSRN